ncbi:TrmB family transcriptional regulator [Geomicrobium sediminis]|uniref:Sugar-specific transcriptional regulator TrmB n=1 Tax=Geomicrobium sediminis TaxID=1347788 RepID=A0ABS2P6M7_9BACL|nr:TrmB family transcriptional regulator [Geomicrobium sediminis]MBM7631057.1 sugar-specific transcriptional regulator TrmB [Geomicrobium sediminis]
MSNEYEDIILTLKNYGLNSYEAKVYLSLLYKNPSNGNMIATDSGVPSPKIYESLRTLMNKGIVFLVSKGEQSKNKLYTPLPYQDLIKRFEVQFSDEISFLQKHLKDIHEQSEQTWPKLSHIEGYEPAIEAIKHFIDESEESILISCWEKELQALLPHLLQAHKRGIRVVSLVFDYTPDSSKIPWRNFTHQANEKVRQRHKNELIIVIDEHKTISVEANRRKANAVISNHQFMVRTAVNYIRHDIYVNRMIADIGHEKLQEIYGENFSALIDDF